MKKSERPAEKVQEFYWIPDEKKVEYGEGTQLGYLHHWRYWRKRLGTVAKLSDGSLVCWVKKTGARIVTSTKDLQRVPEFLPFNRAA